MIIDLKEADFAEQSGQVFYIVDDLTYIFYKIGDGVILRTIHICENEEDALIYQQSLTYAIHALDIIKDQKLKILIEE